MPERWKIVYLWRGERHVSGPYEDYGEALTQLERMWADKWQCWLERIER